MVVGEAMMVAGIGCRKGVSAEQILAAIDTALAHFSFERSALRALATGETKATEEGLVTASEQLRLPLRVIDDAELKGADAKVMTRSGRSLRWAGVGSLAEAAALAAAGENATLLGPRLAAGPVTCAIAKSGDSR
jgi:cobalt-precorrin 5A hydrolase